ncbi:MAG: hypothetical protein HN348_27980 [Proteobacteria bacterium]|nr:hypothetical protein [Pseudomonadota bacterium]
MRAFITLLLLAGCANPITNRVFLADLEFIDALPTRERHHPPSAIQNAPQGDAIVLPHAQSAANDLQRITDAIINVSESLAATMPQERSVTARKWDPVAVVSDNISLFWAKGQMVRSGDNTDITWTIEASDSSSGTWQLLGSGRHAPEGYGDFTWYLDVYTLLTDTEAEGGLKVTYDDFGLDGEQTATYEIGDALTGGEGQVWTTGADVLLGWNGHFQITNDGAWWPGWAHVVQMPEGGRAMGMLYTSNIDEISFKECWTSDGFNQWISGDSGIPSQGSEADCAVEDLFED